MSRTETITLRFSDLVDSTLRTAIANVVADSANDFVMGVTPTTQVGVLPADQGLFEFTITTQTAFATPDGAYNYTGDKTVKVQGNQLPNVSDVMALFSKRAHGLLEIYRDAMQGINNLAANIKNGQSTGSWGQAEYIELTTTAALAAFPNDM